MLIDSRKCASDKQNIGAVLMDLSNSLWPFNYKTKVYSLSNKACEYLFIYLKLNISKSEKNIRNIRGLWSWSVSFQYIYK